MEDAAWESRGALRKLFFITRSGLKWLPAGPTNFKLISHLTQQKQRKTGWCWNAGRDKIVKKFAADKTVTST